jgi:hypothetical protein
MVESAAGMNGYLPGEAGSTLRRFEPLTQG